MISRRDTTPALGGLALFALAALATGCGPATVDDARLPPGPYLGQTPPGTQPVVFASGVVSNDLRQRDTAITADGELLLYTVWGQDRGTIVFVARGVNGWTTPEVVPFSGTYSDIEPFFHPDGSALYFASRRPLPDESEPGDWNLWTVSRKDGTWSDVVPIVGVNTDGDEYYPAVARDGTLYFTGVREPTVGGEDLYRCPRVDGGYGPAQNLGPAVNSAGPDFNAFVAPDQSYVIFGSVRDGDEGGGDLYVSFRDADGAWLPAQNLGAGVNSAGLDYCPFVTADGRYLFFSSTRTVAAPVVERRTYDRLVEALRGPINGQGSLFWVDAGVLERLRDAAR